MPVPSTFFETLGRCLDCGAKASDGDYCDTEGTCLGKCVPDGLEPGPTVWCPAPSPTDDHCSLAVPEGADGGFVWVQTGEPQFR